MSSLLPSAIEVRAVDPQDEKRPELPEVEPQ